MPNLDQYESTFRAAAREVFAYEPVAFGRALIVTDLDEAGAYAFGEQIKQFLGVLDRGAEAPAWDVVTGDEFRTIADLRTIVESRTPDLVCTYRHLHSDQWREPYTLGEYVEVLTQATSIPVVVVPHPEAKRASAHALRDTNVVMAMTDHLAGEHRLVNIAAAFTETNGTLFLAHVEDEVIFERYIDAISKIPTLDTDTARTAIAERLLKEPRDFVESCRTGLEAAKLAIHVETVVTMGHRLHQCRALVEAREIDLLVLPTKDDDQLAMHGLAHPLAVELRQIPLLMI